MISMGHTNEIFILDPNPLVCSHPGHSPNAYGYLIRPKMFLKYQRENPAVRFNEPNMF